MIDVRHEDFDVNEMIARARKPSMGAQVTFLGVVRDDDIEGMELEAYEEVARAELGAIQDEALAKFPIESVDIIHRTGRLKVGENIVLIVVGAGHRHEAFEACEYVIDRIKESVPIWKKETVKGGDTRWVQGHQG